VSSSWLQLLDDAQRHLLAGLLLASAVIGLLAALALLWRRAAAHIELPQRATYYVGHRAAAGPAVYVVTHDDVRRLGCPFPAWGPGADAGPLAAAVLCDHTRWLHPPEAQVSTLAMWLELQLDDGFVLESDELERLSGAPRADMAT
jgi:hypothetical protein